MHYKAKSESLPKLIEPMIDDNNYPIDNLLMTLWKELKIPRLLSRAGIIKRCGHSAITMVYIQMLWRWMNSRSIRLFCHQSLQHFYAMHHSTIYDLLNHPKMNWRGWQWSLAKACLGQSEQGIRALVVDDSIKQRRSKKMDGVSFHYDHTLGRTVKGHQVVALGLSTESGYYPLDQEISISSKGQQSKGGAEPDRRSLVMRRYREAKIFSKIELVGKMVQRFIKSEIPASYLLADSWYGTKAMMRIAIDAGLTGLYRMKNGPLQFRVMQDDGSYRMLNANQIYQQLVRGNWSKSSIVPGSKWRTCEVVVEVNLAQDRSEPDRWQRVKLLYVRGVNLDTNQTPGKRDWALFLSTDHQMSAAQMLEVYAMRWAIEVYFKESKQHLKWLGEASRTYAAHLASLHLSSACYLMLVYARSSYEMKSLGDVREHLRNTVMKFNYARELWQMFQAIIHQAIDRFESVLGTQTSLIQQAIDQQMEEFLTQMLQFEPHIIDREHLPIQEPPD